MNLIRLFLVWVMYEADEIIPCSFSIFLTLNNEKTISLYVCILTILC